MCEMMMQPLMKPFRVVGAWISALRPRKDPEDEDGALCEGIPMGRSTKDMSLAEFNGLLQKAEASRESGALQSPCRCTCG
eukprot:Skav227246  [mRNA]  locus=scaffold2789:228299:228538:+ [translate_table: standard]